jgi:hypothetical protein
MVDFTRPIGMPSNDKEERMPASEYEAAVAAFIRSKGVTRCPTACATPTQASVPVADRVALRRYQAAKDRRREQKVAGRPLLFGSLARL